MWKKLRVVVLLYVLLMVAGGSWLARARSTDWEDTLWVTVYPINADHRETTSAYISSLDGESFDAISRFMAEEASFYGLALDEPIRVSLGPKLPESPPSPPESANPLKVAWWSLRLRYWALFVDGRSDAGPSDIDIFVNYFDPAVHDVLAHSLGLKESGIGVVNAFAARDYAGSNNVIISHELLHTLGAIDKYDPADNQPVFPHGFADPDREPLFPQDRAEVMGGRIPLSRTEAVTPRSLAEVVVGEQTAWEIKWLR